MRLGLRPRAAITHFAWAGDDPIMMLTAIITASRKLLGRAGISLDDVGTFEINETFASVVMAWMKELAVDPARVNQLGGAIAFGRPVGASGGRLLANLLATLETTGERFGLQTMCELCGMANATLFSLHAQESETNIFAIDRVNSTHRTQSFPSQERH